MREQFELLPKGPELIARLFSQVLDGPYPRIDRKRSAAAAELEEKPVDSDYSSANRTIADYNYRRIAYDWCGLCLIDLDMMCYRQSSELYQLVSSNKQCPSVTIFTHQVISIYTHCHMTILVQ